jgi:Uncharacterized protein conserved in bacteria (DUF2330)
MRHQLIKYLVMPGLLALAATLSSQPAAACGGFFCSQAQPVNQAAERIIFADNGDGTITAVIQIQYEGPSERFSWLLPISTVPEGDELGVASDVAFTRLQLATNPQFNLTTVVEGRCRSERGGFSNDSASGSIPPAVGSSSPEPGESVTVEARGVVGAFEWTVISVDAGVADPATPATAWLTQNGYDIPAGAAALLGPYLADGMYLLALRLTKGSDTGSIRPIQLTYAASAPMIPIKLTAVAANQDMGVMTWALSSSRAVPFNYNALELNEARINWFNAASNYGDVVTEAADAAGGQGFVTEFAGPSSQLADVVWQSVEESDWQTVKSSTFTRFGDIFNVVYDRYQGFSGFWDAIRRTVSLPQNLSFEDFRSCPSCYANQVQFSPSELFAAIEADVIEPLRGVQALIDQAPYTTRLYSTLSAAEMTLDPVFVFNPELPDVNNIHQANRVIECDGSVTEFEAPWRIDFPQGTTIRGTANDVGSWPDAVGAQPPNFRVMTLAATGEGVVVADNAEIISSMLADYNSGVPRPRDSGGFCSIGAGAPRRPTLPVALALGALLGATRLRRAARRLGAARQTSSPREQAMKTCR